MNIHGWSPFGFTGLISLLSKGLSRLSSSTTIQKHRFLYAHSSLWTNTHIPFLITSLADYWKNHSLSIGTFVGNVIPLLFNTPSSSIITLLLSRECMFLDSLSRHNKDLEWWTLKPPRRVTALRSWIDRVIALRSRMDHVIALRQISVTALFYLEDSRKIHLHSMRAHRSKDMRRRAPQRAGERVS